jgi:dCMP deaminase
MREDYIDWQTYFIGIAYLSAKRSKDPVTQVGACIVNASQRIVGIGYNGLPYGCDDANFPWGKSEDLVESKKGYVVHAELNAILNARGSLADCSLYVTHFPCHECAKAIVQSGIKRIYFASNDRAERPESKAAARMFAAANITSEKIDELNIDITKVAQ